MTTYWHGGHPGLEVGDYILPPSETNTTHTLLEYGSIGRRDRVYLTTEFAGALFFACVHPDGGHVYEVEPEGELADDPDWFGTSGVSVECQRARIVRVIVPTRTQLVEGKRAVKRMLRSRRMVRR